jgi:hypothetical protein
MSLQRKIPGHPQRRPVKLRSQQAPVNAEQFWPGTLMAFGVFVWLVSFWFIGTRTFIQFSELLRWFALFAFVGNLVPYKSIAARSKMERLEWFLFNLLAIGPFLFAIALSCNFFFHGKEMKYLVPQAHGMDLLRYWRENDDFPLMIPVEFEQQITIAGPGDQLLVVAKGSLGYDVLLEWRPAWDGSVTDPAVP